METIQRMTPDDSPLLVLTQQGAEAANLIIAEKSAGIPRREPSVNGNDRARRDQTEAASSTSPNRRLSEHDARRRITQNCAAREYGRERDDLRNVIEDRRRLRHRTTSPPRRSLAEDVAPMGRSGFRALAGPLRQVRWPDKFKTGNIDRYDGSSNPEEFIQVYQTVIETAGGDDRVKANFLPTALTDTFRSWLINLPEGSVTSWDQLCAMFSGNFQGTYERPSTAETLKTTRQKHDESLQDYVKRSCNARNVIPYIQDIEIINAFRDGVNDIKIVEEIGMKKPKTVANLLAVTDVCIEASEARARLLESRGKGTTRKKDDREVNTADRGNCWTEETADSAVSNPRSRKRRGLFDVPMMRRSGVRFPAPRGTIWRSAKLSWIRRKCHPQQRQCRRNPSEVIIVGKILTEMSRWGRLMLSPGAACPSPPRCRGRSSSVRSDWPSVLSQEEG
jgi:hypothetical protein